MYIVNGDDAGGSFKQAFQFPTESILIFRDVLSCGLLNPFRDIQSWSSTRKNYWADLFSEHGFESIDDIDQAPRDFYKCFDEIKDAHDVNLWIGCSLSDHLLLVFIVMLFQHHKLDTSILKIHQYEKFRDKNLTVIGLSILSPESIKELSPNPFTLNDTQIEFCLETWNAVTSPSPKQLMDILKLENVSLPLLQRALWGFFYRYPDFSDGLSRFDRIILQNVEKHAPNTARVIGETLCHDVQLRDEEHAHGLDTVGDIYLFARLKNMAKPSLKRPLLSLNVMEANLRETRVNITKHGRDVLSGKLNVIDENGINDDIAGVNLRPNMKPIWVRKEREIVGR